MPSEQRWLLLAALAVACGDPLLSLDGLSGSDVGGGSDTTIAVDGAIAADAATAGDAALPLPMCVWNHAYRDHSDGEEVSAILAGAKGCYVLVDPFSGIDAREAIPRMKRDGNVIGCYISSGTCEDWRDDYAAMRPHCVDEEWAEWEGEYLVDTPTPELVEIMRARIDNMAEWGCEMVELDNMAWVFDDASRDHYGVGATSADGIAYNRSLCEYTRAKGMGCMAKNTGEGAADFDGVTFVSRDDNMDWWEAAQLQGFLDKNKLAIIIHYNGSDCDGTYDAYRDSYGAELSYICEDAERREYVHYNE